MKMVKSLFLGSAAGLVAMTGAQAADLPVKAKPVQYVKICSLYGAGFYYIPGTDMCLKIDGYVREQVGWNVNGNLTQGALIGNLDTRSTSNFANRARGYITADARNQTEYGTVRSYIAVGVSGNPDPASGASNTFSANRAFIQFAGFTFGITQSFYDFHATPAYSFWGGLINPSSDSGDGGKQVTAYTMQFGNGLSSTISAEGQRNKGVLGPTLSSGTVTTGAAPANMTPISIPGSSQKGVNFPDIVANLRLDAAWGGAQIMGAIHDASGGYYPAATGTLVGAQANGTTANGNPADALGWVIGAGLKLNTPMFGAGDNFSAQVNYTQGALGYLNNSDTVLYSKFNNSNGTYGYGLMSDSVYGVTPGSIQLTTAWGVNAAYEHFWSKSWQTSVYGGYQAYSYNATANAALCSAPGAGAGQGQVGYGYGLIAGATGVCNNNFNTWNIGSRIQWNVDANTAMGLDIVYQRLETASAGATFTPALFATTTSGATVGSNSNAVRTVANQDAIMAQFRIHRNFYP